jgi:hypothetical protein
MNEDVTLQLHEGHPPCRVTPLKHGATPAHSIYARSIRNNDCNRINADNVFYRNGREMSRKTG